MQGNILVSIVTWNSFQNVKNMVECLQMQLTVNDYIVVVETGGYNQYDSSFFTKGNVSFFYIENVGYAAAHNISVNIMREKALDGILLLNPDLILRNNHISILKGYISFLKNNAVLGVPVFNRINNKLVEEYLGYPVSSCIRNKYKEFLNNVEMLDKLPEIYSVEDVHGCMVYIPSGVISRIGWMDTSYFLYGEENEYWHRALSYGEKIFVCPKLYVEHENGGSFINEKLKSIQAYYKNRNRIYNNFKFNGIKYIFNLNFKYLVKYIIGRYVIKKEKFCKDDENYFIFLGHIHALIGKRGKVFDPNNYV